MAGNIDKKPINSSRVDFHLARGRAILPTSNLLASWLCLAALLVLCLLLTFCSGSASAMESNPPGLRLYHPLLAEPGSCAWFSVLDEGGAVIPGLKLVQGQSENSTPADVYGRFSVTMPEESSSSVEFTIKDQNDNPLCKTSYRLTEGGLFISSANFGKIFDAFLANSANSAGVPQISYAPSALEAHQPYIIVGSNFSGRPGKDQVHLDNLECDVYAGSTVCLVGISPERLSPGPLKELRVAANGESSEPVETDICRIVIDSNEKEKEARLRVLGTNMPLLIELLQRRSSWGELSFEGRKLGPSSSFISPGGDSNQIKFKYSSRNPAEDFSTNVEAFLISDAPWSPDDAQAFNHPKLSKLILELNKAQVVRLRRRQLAVEENLRDIHQQRLKAKEMKETDPSKEEKLISNAKFLSMRLDRLGTMLNARRAIICGIGGAESDFIAAMDEAAGGNLIGLDLRLNLNALAATNAVIARNTKKPTQSRQPDRSTEKSHLSDTTIAMLLQENGLPISFEASTRSGSWRRQKKTRGAAGALVAPPEPYMPDLSKLGNLSKAYGLPPLTALPAVVPSVHKHSLKKTRSKSSNQHKRKLPRGTPLKSKTNPNSSNAK